MIEFLGNRLFRFSDLFHRIGNFIQHRGAFPLWKIVDQNTEAK